MPLTCVRDYRWRWLTGTTSLIALAFLNGCSGWVRAAAGPSFSMTGRTDRAGHSVAVDTVFTAKPKTWLNRATASLPVGFHFGLLGINSDSLKSIGWTTGIALYTPPRPLSGYFIAGTNGHVDSINGRATFGNLNPYVELGVAAQVGSRPEGSNHGFVVTLAVDSQLMVNNLAIVRDEPDKIDLLVGIKYGIGYEME